MGQEGALRQGMGLLGRSVARRAQRRRRRSASTHEGGQPGLLSPHSFQPSSLAHSTPVPCDGPLFTASSPAQTLEVRRGRLAAPWRHRPPLGLHRRRQRLDSRLPLAAPLLRRSPITRSHNVFPAARPSQALRPFLSAQHGAACSQPRHPRPRAPPAQGQPSSAVHGGRRLGGHAARRQPSGPGRGC